MRGSGSLILKIEFGPKFLHSAHISVPKLGLDQQVGKLLRLSQIPVGTYPGTLTLKRVNGTELKKPITIRISADQQNVHEFNLNQLTDEIFLRPVNTLNRTIINCEIKVDHVDANFKVIREEKGLAYRLAPGNYMVSVLLPHLSVRTVPLQINSEQTDYPIPLDIEAVSTRCEPRFRLSVPVVYRTNDGQWISTSSTNMSASGICVIKGIRKISEKDLMLRLFVPIAKGPLECAAKVQWIRDDRNKNSRMGLKLVLPDQTRSSLAKWLEQSSAGIHV